MAPNTISCLMSCALCEESLSDTALFGPAVATEGCCHAFHLMCIDDPDVGCGGACLVCDAPYEKLVSFFALDAQGVASMAASTAAGAAATAAKEAAATATEAEEIHRAAMSDVDVDGFAFEDEEVDDFAFDGGERAQFVDELSDGGGELWDHATFSVADAEDKNLMEKMERVWEDEDKEDECCICFELISTASAVTLDGCVHTFHQQCVARWAQQSNTCPECNTRFTRLVPLVTAVASDAAPAPAEAAVRVGFVTQRRPGSYLTEEEYAAEEARLAALERRRAGRARQQSGGGGGGRRQRAVRRRAPPAAAAAAAMPIDLTGAENVRNNSNSLAVELRADVSTMTCAQLRSRLESLGQNKRGRKSELTERLVAHILS